MGIHVMVEGAIVSHGPVPMHPRLVWCHSGMSEGGDQKSTTFGKSTSRKLLDCCVWKLSALGVVPGDGTEVWGEIHMNRGRVGEEKGGKEANGCPLKLPPFKAWCHDARGPPGGHQIHSSERD
jgi:hypothetical protein